jgi:hypothetical protein
MPCSKLEAMAIYVVNQACGNDIMLAVYKKSFHCVPHIRRARVKQPTTKSTGPWIISYIIVRKKTWIV